MKNLIKILKINCLIAIGLLTMSCIKNNINKSEDIPKDSLSENSNNNITKTGDDILNTDYREFYEDLSPNGKWIKISASDIGLKSKQIPEKRENESSILNSILGIKDAYAETSIGWDLFFVWQPSPSLSVGIAAGESQSGYVPYVNGRWVYTNRGWYFRSPTYCEEIVHHYGRWCYTDSYGWLWIPGRVWAPSWVRWEENDDYIGWAPIETSISVYNQYYYVPPERYVYITTEKRYFLEPKVYNYIQINKWDYDRNKFKDMKRFDGITFNNTMVMNNGPDVKHINKFYGQEIKQVKIKTVDDVKKVRFNKNEYRVFAPEYKKNTDLTSSGKFRDKNNIKNNSGFTENKNLKNDKSGKYDKNEIYSKKIEKNKNNQKQSSFSENKNKNKGNENIKNEKKQNNLNRNEKTNKKEKSFGTKDPKQKQDKKFKQENKSKNQENYKRNEKVNKQEKSNKTNKPNNQEKNNKQQEKNKQNNKRK